MSSQHMNSNNSGEGQQQRSRGDMSAQRPNTFSTMKPILASWLALALTFLAVTATRLVAQETQCAEVRIQIVQELSFERQAFEAGMRITNGLPNTPLTNVNVELIFLDENEQPVQASSIPSNPGDQFFYSQSLLSNINNTTGQGTVAGGAIAEARWLIIPSPGAAGNTTTGKFYYIGARITYDAGGQHEVVEVAPDFVTVRPTPILELDYFLPIDVRADNPSTSQIEPPVPFTLGLRIKNVGLGFANNTRIESSQPEIIENTQNLLINFLITGSYLDDEPVNSSLLMNFGNLPPASARTGRWVMESSLSGQFVSFSASFSHADELGGRTTSLILPGGVRTHLLIKDVLVDLPGRDSVRDFLAADASIPRLYESDGTDSSVTNQSAAVGFGIFSSSGAVTTYYIDVPVTAGALYVRLPDPNNGTRVVQQARRLVDGKILPAENAWFQTEGTGPTTQYSFNLFDVNGGGRYLIDVGVGTLGPVPPVIQVIQNFSVVAGQRLTFLVQASDPNGTIPSLSVDALPFGATFIDYGNGSGQFDWQTLPSQSGQFPVTFRASDGVLSAARTPTFSVQAPGDSDNDGMLDVWELLYFGNLNQGPNDDFDGDGLSNLTEFLLGTDPTNPANAPTVPVVVAPLNKTEVDTLRPTLTVRNSLHGVEVPRYEFEVYADTDYRAAIATSGALVEGSTETSYTLPQDLEENGRYYWRARATLNAAASAWVYGQFVVSTFNEPPSAPVIQSPTLGETVAGRTPRLSVSNAIDPEGESVTYLFGLLGLEVGAPRFLFGFDIPAGEYGTTSWVANFPPQLTGPYFWAVRAIDSRGAYTDSTIGVFDSNPGASAHNLSALPLKPIADVATDGGSFDLVAKTARAGNTTNTYHFELDTEPHFSSPNRRIFAPVTIAASSYVARQAPGPLTPGQRYYWRVRVSDGNVFGPWSTATFRTMLPANSLVVNSVFNPEQKGRVDTLQPELTVFPAESARFAGELRYHFEIYRDPSLLQLVATGTSAAPTYRVAQPLINNTVYFWRAQVEDIGRSVFSAWSPVRYFIVSRDQYNDPPEIKLIAPNAPTTLRADQTLHLRWADSDGDSNANVYFYLNNNQLPVWRTEDEDGVNDELQIPGNVVPPGVYTLNIATNDGTTESRDTSCCQITLAAPSPSADSDGDGIFDAVDNCRFTFNPTQRDSGGFMIATPDNIGDACQCGDLNGDGTVNSADLTHLTNAQNNANPAVLRFPELCNLTLEGQCDSADIQLLASALTTGTAPEQRCQAAVPG